MEKGGRRSDSRGALCWQRWRDWIAGCAGICGDGVDG